MKNKFKKVLTMVRLAVGIGMMVYGYLEILIALCEKIVSVYRMIQRKITFKKLNNSASTRRMIQEKIMFKKQMNAVAEEKLKKALENKKELA